VPVPKINTKYDIPALIREQAALGLREQLLKKESEEKAIVRRRILTIEFALTKLTPLDQVIKTLAECLNNVNALSPENYQQVRSEYIGTLTIKHETLLKVIAETTEYCETLSTEITKIDNRGGLVANMKQFRSRANLTEDGLQAQADRTQTVLSFFIEQVQAEKQQSSTQATPFLTHHQRATTMLATSSSLTSPPQPAMVPSPVFVADMNPALTMPTQPVSNAEINNRSAANTIQNEEEHIANPVPTRNPSLSPLSTAILDANNEALSQPEKTEVNPFAPTPSAPQYEVDSSDDDSFVAPELTHDEVKPAPIVELGNKPVLAPEPEHLQKQQVHPAPSAPMGTPELSPRPTYILQQQPSVEETIQRAAEAGEIAFADLQRQFNLTPGKQLNSDKQAQINADAAFAAQIEEFQNTADPELQKLADIDSIESLQNNQLFKNQFSFFANKVPAAEQQRAQQQQPSCGQEAAKEAEEGSGILDSLTSLSPAIMGR